MSRLRVDGSRLLLDGQDFRLLSGAIHYFRTLPEQWEDRLKKLRACGFNTVETYCCWNLHEPCEGQLDFDGLLDLGRFLALAQQLGLYAIVRPGPYICAEFDYGGLPAWINRYPLTLRCSDPLYLEKLRPYLVRVCQELRPQLAENGGNVLAVQVENEYGSYGNDQAYLRFISELYTANGVDCLQFTSDGYSELNLSSGMLEGCAATVNFGSRARDVQEALTRYRPHSPFICMEFWNGWFDHWGNSHHLRSPQDAVGALGEILDADGGVNLYMFHGGTNFGFTSGANYGARLQSTVTSYDYDAPLSECGDITPKYLTIKAELERRYGKAPDIAVGDSKKSAYGRVELTQRAALADNISRLPAGISSPTPVSMDALGQQSGFVLYSGEAASCCLNDPLELDGLGDRAIVMADGRTIGVIDATLEHNKPILLTKRQGQAMRLDLLVESLGRINYGPRLGDKKGITGGIRIQNTYQFGWVSRSLPMEAADCFDYRENDGSPLGSPTFFRGEFTVGEPCDTFVRLDGFTKGVVLVNGFNLGRYWNSRGPQRTLYLPAPLLRTGKNLLTVLELECADRGYITLTDKPDLGCAEEV